MHGNIWIIGHLYILRWECTLECYAHRWSSGDSNDFGTPYLNSYTFTHLETQYTLFYTCRQIHTYIHRYIYLNTYSNMYSIETYTQANFNFIFSVFLSCSSRAPSLFLYIFFFIFDIVVKGFSNVSLLMTTILFYNWAVGPKIDIEMLVTVLDPEIKQCRLIFSSCFFL